jgi:hypothetical protein
VSRGVYPAEQALWRRSFVRSPSLPRPRRQLRSLLSLLHSASFSQSQATHSSTRSAQAPAHPAHSARSPPLALSFPLPSHPIHSISATMANDPSREDTKDDSATAILRPKKSCVPPSTSRRLLLLTSPRSASSPHTLARSTVDEPGLTALLLTSPPRMTTRSPSSTPPRWSSCSSSGETPSSSGARSARTPVSHLAFFSSIGGATIGESKAASGGEGVEAVSARGGLSETTRRGEHSY